MAMLHPTSSLAGSMTSEMADLQMKRRRNTDADKMDGPGIGVEDYILSATIEPVRP